MHIHVYIFIHIYTYMYILSLFPSFQLTWPFSIAVAKVLATFFFEYSDSNFPC